MLVFYCHTPYTALHLLFVLQASENKILLAYIAEVKVVSVRRLIMYLICHLHVGNMHCHLEDRQGYWKIILRQIIVGIWARLK